MTNIILLKDYKRTRQYWMEYTINWRRLTTSRSGYIF